MSQKFISIPPLEGGDGGGGSDPTAITELTGDATAIGPGSVPITFATVNATTGTFGSTGRVGVFTVNEKGLITSASTAAIAFDGGITQLTGDVAAGPGSGSQAATLATVNSTTGTFGSTNKIGIFTVNAKGLITAASTAVLSTSGITQLTGDATAGPGTGSQALTLATVNATPGTFGSTGTVGIYTVNSKGLIVSSSSVNIAFDGGITQITGDLTAGPGSGSQVGTLATVNATTGTFGSTNKIGIFTVNQKGLITAASTATISTSGITQLTGDGTAGPGTGSQAFTLANVNANTGTFGSTGRVGVYTVNAKGLITASSSVPIAFDGGITQLTGDGTAGPGSGSQALTLATVNSTTGTFGSTGRVGVFTVNSKGLIVSSSSVNIAFDGGITQLTGDLTAGPGSGSQVGTLATVNSSTGTFGSTNKIGIFTVNAKGLITSASTATISTSGITQLTGDVTAGPGTGSQAATVRNVGIYATSSVVIATSAALGATPSSIAGTIVRRGADAQGTFFAVDRVNSAGPFTYIDVENRDLIDDADVASVDWGNRRLNYDSSSASINWSLAVAYDSDFIKSIDWSTRYLYDSNDVQSLDWSNRFLRDSSLSIIADWQGKVLYSNSTGTSIDWFNREILDSRNATSIDYGRRLLQSSGGVATVNWQDSFLADSTASTSINWNDRHLIDSSGTDSAFWDERILWDGDGKKSIEWDTRQLRTSSTAISAKWDITGLGVTALSSTGVAATATTGLGAGVGGSVTISGFGAMAGNLTLNTGSVAGPVSTTAATITLSGNPKFPKQSKVFLQPRNAATAGLYGEMQVFPGGSTGNNIPIITGSSGLDTNTSYRWSYLVIG